MLLLPLTTPLLRRGDNLAKILTEVGDIRPGDIIAISSKAIATVEGGEIDLTKLNACREAIAWSEKTGLPADFCQAIMNECVRLNGEIIRAVPHALMTRLRPEGLRRGQARLRPEEMETSLLVPNAGLDRSNIEEGFCIGWPLEPVESGRRLRKELDGLLECRMENRECRTRHSTFDIPHSHIGIIITDSCLRPGRRGVTAMALTVSGMAPIRSEKGTQDLFNNPLVITEEATADQLATAANILMGNAAQSTPTVIIRDHGIVFEDWDGWVPGMNEDEDVFPQMG